MQMTRDENHELAIHFWADGTQPDPLHGSMETLTVGTTLVPLLSTHHAAGRRRAVPSPGWALLQAGGSAESSAVGGRRARIRLARSEALAVVPLLWSAAS